MKKNPLTFLGLCLTLAVAAVMAPRSYAVSGGTADAVLAAADATAAGARVSGGAIGSIVSTTTVMNLTYTGSAADAEITVTQASGLGTVLSFYAPGATLATDIGAGVATFASGSFDLSVSTMATFGQLCDAINTSSKGNWHCTLSGVTRGDSPQQILNTAFTAAAGVNSLKAQGGYSVAVGTATYMSLGIIPAAGRRVILTQCQVNQEGTALKVFGRPRGFSSGYDRFGNSVTDSYLVWNNLLTANTLAYVPSQYTVAPWLEFAANQGFSLSAPPAGALAYNGHVTVEASNYGVLLNQTTSNYLQCSWLEK